MRRTGVCTLYHGDNDPNQEKIKILQCKKWIEVVNFFHRPDKCGTTHNFVVVVVVFIVLIVVVIVLLVVTKGSRYE